jgi:3-hydroxybutyryl-CoA dehydrogenase
MPQPNKDEKLGKMIFDRILIMLINEAADALFWQIASKEDIDTAMMNGTNYPKGLLRWADEIGISECVNRMDALYELYREDRYRCSSLLRKMAGEGKSFY